MKNIAKTILIFVLNLIGQFKFSASATDSGVLESVLAEQKPSTSFNYYYSLWASDSDDDAEKARVFFRSHVEDHENEYFQAACGLLINGNSEDKNFVLPHVRTMQESTNAKISAWASSFLLTFGKPDDGLIAIGRLKELLQSEDIIPFTEFNLSKDV